MLVALADAAAIEVLPNMTKLRSVSAELVTMHEMAEGACVCALRPAALPTPIDCAAETAEPLSLMSNVPVLFCPDPPAPMLALKVTVISNFEVVLFGVMLILPPFRFTRVVLVVDEPTSVTITSCNTRPEEFTKAVVATFVELSPAACVVAVAAPRAGAFSDVMSVLAPDRA